MAQTYEPIATNIVSSAVGSVTFSSIPTTYTDLILIANYWDTESGNDARCMVQVGNGSIDTASNYSMTSLYGNGTTASSTANASRTQFDDQTGGANVSSSAPALNIYQFLNYSNTTTYKTVLYRQNNLDSAVVDHGTSANVGLWRSTSAINTIKIYPRTGTTNIRSGASFTIYGIKAA